MEEQVKNQIKEYIESFDLEKDKKSPKFELKNFIKEYKFDDKDIEFLKDVCKKNNNKKYFNNIISSVFNTKKIVYKTICCECSKEIEYNFGKMEFINFIRWGTGHISRYDINYPIYYYEQDINDEDFNTFRLICNSEIRNSEIYKGNFICKDCYKDIVYKEIEKERKYFINNAHINWYVSYDDEEIKEIIKKEKEITKYNIDYSTRIWIEGVSNDRLYVEQDPDLPNEQRKLEKFEKEYLKKRRREVNKRINKRFDDLIYAFENR